MMMMNSGIVMVMVVTIAAVFAVVFLVLDCVIAREPVIGNLLSDLDMPVLAAAGGRSCFRLSSSAASVAELPCFLSCWIS